MVTIAIHIKVKTREKELICFRCSNIDACFLDLSKPSMNINAIKILPITSWSPRKYQRSHRHTYYTPLPSPTLSGKCAISDLIITQDL